jgi:hypothetical protein
MTARRGRKPEGNPSETGAKPGERGAYTVETRARSRGRTAPKPAEPDPQDALASLFEALGAAGQIGIYRTAPNWARGHLQTLTLNSGERFDFDQLDALGRFWGGGTYQFRPMQRGRFAGSSRSITLDGPTLYRGKPHPNDPERERRAAAAEVLPAAPGYPPPGYPAAYGYQQQPGAYPELPQQRQPSPELQMLGSLVERMLQRMDSLEGRLAAPAYEPARAPDHMSGVLQTLQMAQQIRELLDGPQDDDDDDDDAGGMPTDPQSMLMMLAAKKLAGDDPDVFGGGAPRMPTPPAPAPAAAPPANGPRLIRGGGSSTPNPPPTPEAAPALDAQSILAAIQHLAPAERARLVNDVGQQLDPETLAEMAAQMQAAGGGG